MRVTGSLLAAVFPQLICDDVRLARSQTAKPDSLTTNYLARCIAKRETNYGVRDSHHRLATIPGLQLRRRS